MVRTARRISFTISQIMIFSKPGVLSSSSRPAVSAPHGARGGATTRRCTRSGDTYLVGRLGPPLSFANDVSLHLPGLITNGAFNRFPALKVMVDHLGEYIPIGFWRINHWLQDVERLLAEKKGDVMCQQNIYYYFKRDIWVRTSGRFSTEAVGFVKGYLGAERGLWFAFIRRTRGFRLG
ncbi:hypothetical protein BJY00DRAFT_315782 [Aspergillus carlsbadensis]|nr:hypothetical protein BJY00DRAFT_315782 [Aspergillus carlsbadensis]